MRDCFWERPCATQPGLAPYVALLRPGGKNARGTVHRSIACCAPQWAELCNLSLAVDLLRYKQLRFLQGCPDPDPIPPGYKRVGESFTCVDGFVENSDLTLR